MDFKEYFKKDLTKIHDQLFAGIHTLNSLNNFNKKFAKVNLIYAKNLKKIILEEIENVEHAHNKDFMGAKLLMMELLKFERFLCNSHTKIASNLEKVITHNEKSICTIECDLRSVIKQYTKSQRKKTDSKIIANNKMSIEPFLMSCQSLEDKRLHLMEKNLYVLVKQKELFIEDFIKYYKNMASFISKYKRKDDIKFFCKKYGKISSTKENRSSKSKSQFGLSTAEIFLLDENKNEKIPKIITECCKWIRELDGFKTQGIFRISCNKEIYDEAVKMIDRGDYNLGKFKTPHVPALLLKTIFKDMLEPIIPKVLTDKCAELGAKLVGNVTKPLPEFDEIMEKIPAKNVEVLKYLSNFLIELSFNESVTKMGISNLAIVFTPTLTRVNLSNDIHHAIAVNERLQNFVIYMVKVLGQEAKEIMEEYAENVENAENIENDEIDKENEEYISESAEIDKEENKEIEETEQKVPPPIPKEALSMYKKYEEEAPFEDNSLEGIVNFINEETILRDEKKFGNLYEYLVDDFEENAENEEVEDNKNNKSEKSESNSG